jgi:hypothetical protein
MMPRQPDHDDAFKASVFAALRRFIVLLLDDSPEPVMEPDILKRAFYAGRPEADFAEDSMQDCAEFLNRILAILADRGKLHRKVGDVFRGVLQSTVICAVCQNESKKDDIIDTWNLEIPGPTTVEAVFNAHLANEELPADNYTCAPCNKKTPHVKSIQIIELSSVLVLNFKRFAFDTKSLKQKKTNDRVTFEKKLTVTVKGVEYYYSLSSIIVHLGQSLERGHFIVFFNKGEKWFEANDKHNKLKEVNWDKVQKQKAYLLFYDKESTASDDNELTASDDYENECKTRLLLSKIPRMLINTNVDCYRNSVYWALSCTKGMLDLLHWDPVKEKKEANEIDRERESKVLYIYDLLFLSLSLPLSPSLSLSLFTLSSLSLCRACPRKGFASFAKNQSKQHRNLWNARTKFPNLGIKILSGSFTAPIMTACTRTQKRVNKT